MNESKDVRPCYGYCGHAFDVRDMIRAVDTRESNLLYFCRPCYDALSAADLAALALTPHLPADAPPCDECGQRPAASRGLCLSCAWNDDEEMGR